MSYFPQTAPDKLVTSLNSYAAFTTRVDLGTGVRGAVASPDTYTTAAFTVPALYTNVTIAVASSSNFIVGDYVMVGTRGMYLTSPVHATSGPGVLNFEGRYFAGRLAAADASSGLLMIGSNGLTTTNTAVITALPNWINPGGTNNEDITVANRENIPSNSWVLLTNYAGVYKVASIPGGTSLELTYVIAGDIPTGSNCIVDLSASDLGAKVTQFYPLGVVPKGFILNFRDVFLTSVSVSGATATTANISLGWVNSQYSGAGTRMREFIDNVGQQAGSVLSVNSAMQATGQETNTSTDRWAPMNGMAFGIRVNTASSTSFVVDVLLRGFLTPFV